VASWPGLVDVYLKHLQKGGDLMARRPGGDGGGVRLLRRIVAAADDEERCGGLDFLWRKGLWARQRLPRIHDSVRGTGAAQAASCQRPAQRPASRLRNAMLQAFAH
jgi:hypothetical protein